MIGSNSSPNRTWPGLKYLTATTTTTTSVTTTTTENLLSKLRGLKFYCGKFESNEDCCFNHMIGLPQKNGVEKPLFSYQQALYDILFNVENNIPAKKDKHLWILKATGLGITEYFLRLMVWLCLKDDRFKNSQMVIVTGPNISLAIGLVKRMKALFYNSRFEGISFDSKETVLELNGCRIESYPSHHIDSFRSLSNPKFILLDEADFFPVGQQQDVRHVSERYIAKSDPYIVMFSTPNAPGGLFETIDNEPAETCIYSRVNLDYTYGLGKIYTQEDIDKARASPSFEREYNLKFAGQIGNLCSPQKIDLAVVSDDYLTPQAEQLMKDGELSVSVGIDPSFGGSEGSSKFGLCCILKRLDGYVYVDVAEEYTNVTPTAMFDKLKELIDTRYGWSRYTKHINDNIRFYVDASNPGFISDLKTYVIGEESNYLNVIDRCRHDGVRPEVNMCALPIPFSKYGKEMLEMVQMLIADEGIKIPARHKELIRQLRIVKTDEHKNLAKSGTCSFDVLDALRLALKYKGGSIL
jgi:hypothetical protein